MLNKSDIIEIKIDSLAHGGEGIGRHEGIPVFVAETAPGDVVKAEIISAKQNYAKAKLVEVIEPSPHRIKPFCPIAKACGGCQWQHIAYDEQLKAKKKIVEDSFKKIAGVDVPVKDVLACENTTEYRCKVQYPVQQTKNSKRFLAGYYKKGSHDLVNIKYCPIQAKIIDEITEYIRDKAQQLELTAYNERTKKGLIRHIVYRYSYTHKNLALIIVINSQKSNEKLATLCNAVKSKFKEIIGVLVNFNTKGTNVILGNNYQLINGQDYIEENLEGRKFKISAGSFFQVNPPSAVKMFNEAESAIKSRLQNPTVLDVYAGVGSFTIWLKDIASKIVAIEENPYAVSDARENLKLNNCEDKITYLEGNADKLLADLANENTKFDVVVLDPPRKGCAKEAIDAIIKLAEKYIIYVSCDPATLARDVKILNENGFIPEYVQPVDMFCHTYHIESIVVLKRDS